MTIYWSCSCLCFKFPVGSVDDMAGSKLYVSQRFYDNKMPDNFI